MVKKQPIPRTSRNVSGPAREKFAVQAAQQYVAGESIREIATFHGRSYGFIHSLLREGGVRLRSRGGVRLADRPSR